MLLLTLAENRKARISCNCKDALRFSLCFVFKAEVRCTVHGHHKEVNTTCPSNAIGPEFNQRSLINVGEEDEIEEEVIACNGPCLARLARVCD